MRVAYVIAAVVLAGCAAQRDFNGLVNGTMRADTYDFGRLRFEQPEAFAALQTQVEAHFSRLAAEENRLRAIPAGDRPSQCAPDLGAQIRLRNWIRLAAASPDRAAWDSDAAALRERISGIAAAAEALASGSAEIDPRTPVRSLADLIDAHAAAQDGRLRELLSRALRDQTLRFGFGFDEETARWREGLSPNAEEAWRGLLGALIVETDCSNTDWLRRQLSAIDWFDRRTFGDAADKAAWLLVQHADMTPAFQVEMLARLERLASEGGTRPQSFAYLWDRVAVADHRPQRYGTQMECVDGANRPTGGLEDQEHVEDRRAVLHMQSYESYLAVMARLSPCSAAD
jgi:hypothetical protein